MKTTLELVALVGIIHEGPIEKPVVLPFTRLNAQVSKSTIGMLAGIKPSSSETSQPEAEDSKLKVEVEPNGDLCIKTRVKKRTIRRILILGTGVGIGAGAVIKWLWH